MGVFKATKNASTAGVFKATKNRSYDSAFVSRLEDENRESSSRLNDYITRRQADEWMSEDDIKGYRDALDRYRSSSKALSDFGRTFGSYNDEDEKQRTSYIDSIAADLDSSSGMFKSYKNADEYGAAVSAYKEREAMKTANLDDISSEITALERKLASERQKIGSDSALSWYPDKAKDFFAGTNITGIQSDLDAKRDYYNKVKEVQDYENHTAAELYKLADEATENTDSLYWRNLANRRDVQEKSNTLAGIRMDGERVTVLEALNDLSSIEDGNSRRQREKAIKNKMASLGLNFDDYYSRITGEGNFSLGNAWEWAKSALASGTASWNKGISSTADLILGKPLQALGWEKNPISAAADYYSDSYNNYAFDRSLYASKMGGGKALDYAGQFVEGVVSAVPDAILAGMTAGASAGVGLTSGGLATKAAYQSGDKLTKAGLTIEGMMKNPNYWSSFARTYGLDYEEAKASGASDTAAALGATITSLINAGIEIGFDGGSGFQGLAQDLAEGGRNKFWAWAESSLEEGGEEILQGFVNNLVSKVMYDDSTELANIEQMIAEGGMGVAVGAALGGGEVILRNAANSAIRNQEIKKAMRNFTEFSGKSIVEGDTVRRLVDSAGTLGNTRAEQKLKALAESIAGVDPTADGFSKKSKSRLEKSAGKLYRGLVETKGESFENSRRAAISDGIRKELEVVDVKDIDRTVSVLTKYAVGDNLTKSEKALMDMVGGKSIVERVMKSGVDENTARAYADYNSSAALPFVSREDTELGGKKHVDVRDRVSSTGYTVKADTGENITVNKENAIDRIENGEAYINTDKGTVKLSNIEFANENEARLYESFLDYDSATASALIKNYDGSISVERYVNGMRQGINVYGRYNFQGVGIDISKDSFFADLSPTDQRYALNIGRSIARAEAQAAQTAVAAKTAAKTRGKVQFAEGVTAETKAQKNGVALAKHLASALGINITFFDSTKDVQHRNDNGWYDPATDSIHLDINAGDNHEGTIAYTLGHELTHFIKKWSPEKFKVFGDFLVEQYGKHGISTQEMLEAQMAKLNTTDEAVAYEEMVADACQTMLLDSNAVEKLIQLRQQDKGLFEKIKEFIHNILAKLRKEYAGIDPNSDEAKALRSMTDVVEQMSALFEDAAVDAAQAHSQAADGLQTGETKFQKRSAEGIEPQDVEQLRSIGRKSVNEFTSEEIQKAEKWARKFYRELGTKSPFFRAWFGDWRAQDTTPIIVADTIGQERGIVRNNDTQWDIQVSGRVFGETKIHTHKQNVSARAYLPYINSIVQNAVLLDTVAIPSGKEKSANSAWMHSLYAVADVGNGKELLKLYVEELNDVGSDGTIRRAYQLQNIEKWQPSAKGSGASSLALSASTATVKSISDLFSVVNSKDKNFHPKPVSKALLNADGTPMVVYHGTRDTFTTFELQDNPKFGRALGDGFYFTSNYDKAFKFANGIFSKGQDRGGIIMPVYLRMENPYVIQLDADRTKWMREYKSGDYDGIIDLKHETYYVESPTQIKSATDNIGTFDGSNPDIRYSRRTKEAPKKTQEVYKLMRLKDGDIYPLFIDSTEPLDIGVWYDADSPDLSFLQKMPSGIFLVDANDGSYTTFDDYLADSGEKKTKYPSKKAIEQAASDGKRWVYIEDVKKGQKRFGGESRKYWNLGINGSGAVSTFSMRPGYHAGSLPSMRQIGKGVNRDLRDDSFVWTVGEVPADIDYQSEADSNPDKDIPTHIPVDGYYLKATNADKAKSQADVIGWYVAGSYKINRIISDSEARSIIDQWNAEHPDAQAQYDYERESGMDFDADSMRLVPKGSNAEGDDKHLRQGDREVQPVKTSTRNKSNRELLSEALETTIDTSTPMGRYEAKLLWEYKENVEMLDGLQSHLKEVNAEIRALTFGDAPRDPARLRALKDEKIKTENRIGIYDKKLLRLEATQPIRDVLEREKKQLKQEMVTTFRESTKKQKAQSETRGKLKRVIKSLDQLLNHGTKERNVKADMQETVGAVLSLGSVLFNDEIANEDIVKMGAQTATPEEQKLLDKYMEYIRLRDNSEFNEARKYISKISALNSRLSELFARERERLNRTKVADAVTELSDAYARLKNSGDDFVSFAYDSEVAGRIAALKEELGGTTVQDMTNDQLRSVYEVFRMVKHMVSTSNSLFRMGKAQSLSDTTRAVQSEVLTWIKQEHGDPAATAEKVVEKFRSFGWNELKPVYAFERLGSDTYMQLFWDAINAEGVWARDVEEAKTFLDAQVRRTGYRTWDMQEAHEFRLPGGQTFKLTLQEMMSIYAYSKREQAYEHMTVGGFQFAENSEYRENGRKKLHSTGELYTVDADTIKAIIEALTPQQAAYVDAVQSYLTELGKKGNEVSRALYGIDLFTEKVYFTLMSARDYRSSVETALNATQTQASLKNTGMSKPTVPHAKNPIILQGFDAVVNKHIDTMSKYHAYVLPIENLRRVFDSTTIRSDGRYVSTKNIIKRVYGKAAMEYFDNYITDLNGGTFIPGYNSPVMGMFSKFKATAVGASLSVIIQQPFAIIRAMNMISPQYFVFGKVGERQAESRYAEIKKYAPVAIIKEMGGFDMGNSRTAAEYLTTRTDKGLKRTVDTINNAAQWGAGKADELGWGIIWDAVKRETYKKGFKYGSKEFYEACGKRFTEVITYTQVYDSVNSRSGMMRSKHDSVKFATSFMGEPTTVINMAYSAVLKVQRAKGSAAKRKAFGALMRTAGVLLASALLNGAAKSFVYAGRDDDDDEAYFERWAEQFAGSMHPLTGDISPLTMLPYVKDIVSLFQGYDVERPDMTLIANVVSDIIRVIDKWDDMDLDTALSLIGDVGNLCGLPLKNIIRDTRGVINTVGDAFDSVYPTDIGGALMRGFSGESQSNTDALYGAIMRGDSGRIEVIREKYKTDASYETAVKRALRENDPRITEALKSRVTGDNARYQQIRQQIIDEGNFDKQTVNDALKAEYDYYMKKIEEAAKLMKEGDTVSSGDIILELKKKYKGVFKQDDIMTMVKRKAGLLK